MVIQLTGYYICNWQISKFVLSQYKGNRICSVWLRYMVAILGGRVEQYCSIMQDFLAAKGENADLLQKAYEFGTNAIAADLSIRDITAIHKQALSNILAHDADAGVMGQIANIVNKATDILTQSLLPIEESRQRRSLTKLICTGSSEERLQWMYDLASHLNEANTLDEIYHVTLQGIRQILKTERAAILMFDDRSVLRYQASMGISETYKQAVENYCASLDEIPQAKLGIFSDTGLQPGVELLDTMRKTEDINAAASFPMEYQGRQLGKIAVYYDTPHQFTKDEIQLVQTITMYTSVAITRKRAEIDLKESQRFAQSIAESIPDILYVYDMFEQREVYTNKAIGKVLGYTPEELVEMGSDLFPILVHPDDMTSFFGHVSQLHSLQAGEAVEQEYRVRHTNGEWRWMYSRNTVFLKDVDGSTKQFLGIARDITDRKRAEEKLVETQQFLQSILDNFPGAINVFDREDKHILVNRHVENVLSQTNAELRGTSLHEVLPPDFAERVSAENKQVFESGIPVELEGVVPQSDGLHTYVTNKFPLFNEQGLAYAVCGISTDITARKRAEVELLKTQQFLQSILDNFPGAIYVLDKEDRHILVNHHVEKIIAHTNAELSGKTIHDVLEPDFAARISASNKQVFESGMPLELEAVVPQADGLHTYITMRFPLFNEQNLAYAVCGISLDITDRIIAEMQLQESLKEKELLLKEIHHRVKNNLQVVAGLLNLQKRAIADPAIAQLFEDSKNRVFSMAMIHESLYQSKQLNQVNLAKYLQDLIDALAQSNDIQNRQIQFQVNADAIDVNIETAMPCGLIVNELVTNSIKHAFPNLRQGQVLIECRSICNGEILLSVRDDGVGIPTHVDINKASSLGLRITKNLVRQLKGTMEIESSSHGSCFSLKFAELAYQNRI
jgi:PAS domain S-box-containing protein